MKKFIKKFFSQDSTPEYASIGEFIIATIYVIAFMLVCGFAGWLDSRW